MSRLSPGTLILGVFAILFGLLGAYAVKKYVQAEPVEVAEPPREREYRIPVASLDLPAGRTIVNDDVTTLVLRRQDLAKMKFPSSWMDAVPQIVGRTLIKPQKAGQPFQPSLFYPKGMRPSVAADLKPGERAVTIPFKADSTDPAFLSPGAVVDVLFRTNPDERAAVPDATVTLLSSIRVLAVGQKTVQGEAAEKPQSGETQTVTLAVNQAQARALKVVEGRGTFMLALRGEADREPAQKEGPVTLPGLLGLKEPPHEFVSELYQRGQLSTLTFADGHRQKIKLDPPYGLPVSDKAKDGKAGDLEVWPYGYGWGGYGRWGYGSRGSGRGETIPYSGGYRGGF
jgi:Flp pilus assembly protein CpaB